ncbi:MAG: hypothetical protein JSU03_11090 [Bacteroidetes bacterium]|nr:hypothetical protein [Bacteroidota bacterium]MBS1757815.1 hypothetical protein [Bacteroidota bacterium]
MKKIFLLFLTIFSFLYQQAQENIYSLAIKRLEKETINHLVLRKFQPVTNTYSRLNYKKLRKGSTLFFTFILDDSGFINLFDSTINISIGPDIFVGSSKTIEVNYYNDEKGVVHIKDQSLFPGDNMVMDKMYKYINGLNTIYNQNMNPKDKGDSVLHLMDIYFRDFVYSHIPQLDSMFPMSKTFRVNCLYPEIEAEKTFYKIDFLKRSNLNINKAIWDSNYFLTPSYKFWKAESVSYNIFPEFLYYYFDGNKSSSFFEYISKVSAFYSKNEILKNISIVKAAESYKEHWKGTLSPIERMQIDSILEINYSNVGIQVNKENINEIKSIKIQSYFDSTINLQEILVADTFPKYIDTWASWCSPCVKEMPYTLNLKKQYINKISFIYISIDEDVKKWKIRCQSLGLPLQNCFRLADDSVSRKLYEHFFESKALPVYKIFILRPENALINTYFPSDSRIYSQFKEL